MTEREKKEKVLHTRVPVVLEVELKRVAEGLRVPVSNLVRTILEDALTTAEAVGKVAEEELRGAAERLTRERGRLREVAEKSGRKARRRAERDDTDENDDAPETEPIEPEPSTLLDGVLGFQELVLAMPKPCALCGVSLEAGDKAFIGVTDGAAPGARPIIGPECLPGPGEEEQGQKVES